MSEQRTRTWSESHLLPDAVVAFVDAELSVGAHERAAAHIAQCPSCAGDVAAQRQARTAVRGADAPPMSAGFLASLRSIPDNTDTQATPDNLAVTEDGQLVAVQRPERVAGVTSSSRLGSSTPLGNSDQLLGSPGSAALGRRTAQGAGVVVSGIVLGALVLVVTGGLDGEGQRAPGGPVPPDVLRAQFNVPSSALPSSTQPSSTLPSSTQPSSTRPSAPAASSGGSAPAPSSAQPSPMLTAGQR